MWDEFWNCFKELFVLFLAIISALAAAGFVVALAARVVRFTIWRLFS